MKRKADCPSCHEAVKLPGSSDYEKGILPNKSLEQQVDVYKRCRGELRASLVRLDILEKGGMVKKRKGGVKDERGTRSSKRARSTVAKKTNYSDGESDDGDDDNDEDYCDEDYDPTSYSKKPSASCNQIVSDDQPPLQLRRKPTVSYHSMNRKKLADLCQREGLSTLGSEKELKQRHSEFITLYNSECDSDHPRSVKELVKEMKKREMTIKMEANRAGLKKQSKCVKNLGDSLQAYNEGSIGKPTSGNEGFDAELNNNFTAMIAAVKMRKGQAPTGGGNGMAVKSNGEAQESGIDVHRVASLNSNEINESHTAIASSQQQPTCNTEPECINNDAVSPSASIDSDKTVETPQKSSAAKPKAVVTKRSSSKKSKPSRSNSNNITSCVTRVNSVGPWICNSCTYENQRNVTKKARCEMCNTARPKPKDSAARDIEVVNIDC